MDATQAQAIKNQNALRPGVAIRSASKKRGRKQGSLVFFYSSKNDLDLVFPSQLEFAHALTLEADERCCSYQVGTARVLASLSGQGFVGSVPDAIVKEWNGATRLVEVKYTKEKSSERALYQAEVQSKAAAAIGAGWSWFSESDAHRSSRIIHDWLQVASVLSQTRMRLQSRWDHLRRTVLEATVEELTLGDVRRLAIHDWDIVFSAIFRLIQVGDLASDLGRKPLSAETLVKRRLGNAE